MDLALLFCRFFVLHLMTFLVLSLLSFLVALYSTGHIYNGQLGKQQKRKLQSRFGLLVILPLSAMDLVFGMYLALFL